MNAILQDTYDVNDDGGHSSGDVAIDFFDAPTMFAERLVATDDADNDNADPTEKLIHAIQALRDVIIDNTNVQQRARARRAGAGGGCGGSAAAGAGIAGPGRAGRNHKTNNMFKDERLKIRSQKVSDSLDSYNFSNIYIACQCCRLC